MSLTALRVKGILNLQLQLKMVRAVLQSAVPSLDTRWYASRSARLRNQQLPEVRNEWHTELPEIYHLYDSSGRSRLFGPHLGPYRAALPIRTGILEFLQEKLFLVKLRGHFCTPWQPSTQTSLLEGKRETQRLWYCLRQCCLTTVRTMDTMP